MERIKLGTITKPQALKGAFRVKPDILNYKKFKKINEIFIDNKAYNIQNVSIRDAFVILKVEGIESCESAELLRNKSVFGDVEIDKNETLDLVGWEVQLGNIIGKIIDINNYGSKDILTVLFEKNCMVPVIDGLILSSDENTKKIVLNKEIFEQVAVYENWYFNTFSRNVWTFKI